MLIHIQLQSVFANLTEFTFLTFLSGPFYDVEQIGG